MLVFLMTYKCICTHFVCVCLCTYVKLQNSDIISSILHELITLSTILIMERLNPKETCIVYYFLIYYFNNYNKRTSIIFLNLYYSDFSDIRNLLFFIKNNLTKIFKCHLYIYIIIYLSH